MAEPRWSLHGERAVGDGNLSGLPDTMNRAAKDVYELWKLRHNDDGTHKLDGILVCEPYTYTGLGTGQTVSLQNANITIDFIQISRPDTETPVFACSNMAADETKQIGTAAFQSSLITDIATQGEFTVGSDAAVDAIGVVYSYLVFGTIS